jgi:hypothetical protein
MSQDWLTLAKSELNKPYIWGGGRVGSDPAGFDCSGFVSFIMKQGLGVNVPAFTGSAYTATRPLTKDESPQPGDIVFYNMGSSDPHVQHMALYIGNGQIIQAGGTHNNVNIDSVNSVGTPTFHRANGLNSDLENNMATASVSNVLPKSTNAAPTAALDYNDKAAVTSYIQQAAIARGIDPNVAVAVANSEGLNTYVGDQGSSFGPYQLHYGGGLGDSFTKSTGLDARDQSTVRQQIDYALDNAATSGWGAYHGAARMGIGNFTGIGANAHAVGVGSGTGGGTGGSGGGSDPISTFISSMTGHTPIPSVQSLFGQGFGVPSSSGLLGGGSPLGGGSFGGGSQTSFGGFPSAGQVRNSWIQSDSNNMLQYSNPLASATPMNFLPKSPYDAPPAQPNFMSLMTRPGSIYGG